MKRLSTLFSVFLVIWFILLDHSIIIARSVDYFESSENDESIVTTQNTSIFETTTGIDIDYQGFVFIENVTSIVPETKQDLDQSESISDDIIELNVSGQRITTFRSTLTVVSNSKLALLFSKDKAKSKSKHFFDYNPIQFEYLLDQLRSIKRMPEISAYELNFVPPNAQVAFNFSTMILELGLNPDRFLFPIVGTHLNLRVESLVGWKQCFHGKYNIPFDSKVLTNVCKGKRLLVACRSTNDTKTLVVAGIGKREDIFSPCTAYEYCTMEKKNGISFYYVHNHVWGFKGSPDVSLDDPIEMDTEDDGHGHGHGHDNHQQEYDEVVDLDTCDQSDLNSEYRLCWSLRSNIRRRVGDRCGSLKNLHNTEGWERLIYHID